MLFKLPLLLIVESYFFFFNTNARRTPIYKMIQAGLFWLNQVSTEVGGPGAHLLSTLLGAPEKHQGPRNRLVQSTAPPEGLNYPLASLFTEIHFFHIKKLNLYVNVVIGKIPLSLISHTQYISKCRFT